MLDILMEEVRIIAVEMYESEQRSVTYWHFCCFYTIRIPTERTKLTKFLLNGFLQKRVLARTFDATSRATGFEKS